ncbi:type VI secretion system Vgr family protein [Chryseobacterium wangxinyae]|uniref:type VI secretion system Vgr family protein n=1 Tax=Chryseobacterium sp. CY353 TaxID=2997334 RepID=UPI00226DC773|nr:contractile injection system protein, VgrG/Pvc8 family [Chryseobacterium sp. CY353]MCY0970740.1 contractile injection system protein, VgrG/Pvc8 family [Chryseobacterium sp. CY353]
MENQDFSTIFGTSRRFEDWLHDKTNPLVYCLLTLDGKDFIRKNSYTVELSQKTNDHDRFTIVVPDDALDTFKGYVMENSKNLLGKAIGITYWRFGKSQHYFRGIIGNVRNKKDEGGGYGELYITGFAPSILLESGKDCQSFEDKTLEQIVKQVTEGYPQEAKVEIASGTLSEFNKKALPYTVQYKESDYQFIKRLAIRHGEYFYYNGEKLIFGNTVQPILKLSENIDLIDVEFEMRIQAQDFTFTGYDTESGARIEKDSSNARSHYKENLFQVIATNASKSVFKKKPKMHFNHTGIQNWSEGQLAEAVRLEREKRENLMQVKGRSKTPELKIGGRAKLSDINGKAMETYRIIEIKHVYEPGDYYNEFVGIPDIFSAVPYLDTEAVPKGEEQPARVMDNNDPMGMGRVRVQFPWQENKGEKTPWVRLIQPHSGAGKGFHFIPEIGEEVLVGHESQNAEKPFVMGTHYNGGETSSYHTSGNDKKVIHTRSGTKIILNDAEGSVFIEDPSGNTYLMDGAGNINVNAPKNFTVNAGENITMTAGKDVSVSAGNNISNSANDNITSVAGTDIMQTASGEIRETSDIRTEMVEKEFKRQSETSNEVAGEVSVFSAKENMTMQSGKIVEFNSAEKSKLF